MRSIMDIHIDAHGKNETDSLALPETTLTSIEATAVAPHHQGRMTRQLCLANHSKTAGMDHPEQDGGVKTFESGPEMNDYRMQI